MTKGEANFLTIIIILIMSLAKANITSSPSSIINSDHAICNSDTDSSH